MSSKISALRRPLTNLFYTRKYSNKLELSISAKQGLPWAWQKTGVRASNAPDDVRYDAHMNELPVPCIPWEPWYTQKQKVYTRHLVFGIVWWLFSFGMALYTDSIYLNCSPPRQPGPPSDMVETCIEPDD